MRIGLTGVPGTGKTTLGKQLAEKLDLKYFSVNDIVNEHNLWITIDPTDNAKVVNIHALEKTLNSMSEDNFVIEGHLLCEIKMRLDKLIVLRTYPNVLGKRLEERGYPSAKIKANVYSEVMDYCTEKAIRNYPKEKVYEVLTDRSVEDSLKNLEDILKNGEKFRAPWVEILKLDSS